MRKRILILDDDDDFNALLTDIFDQADYEVESRISPSEALEVFRNGNYDVVISDQQMPDMPGSVFMAEVHKIDPNVPVVMVSGYLNNDTIRDLIRDGVAGVFLKPLNIMALLERCNELVAERERAKKAGPAIDDANSRDALPSRGRLDFPFRSFPCRSEVSVKFARKLYDYRNFKSALCLVGEPGIHFRSICEDIVAMNEENQQRCVFLNPGSITEEYIKGVIRKQSQEGIKLLTLVVMDLESLDEAQRDLLGGITQRENTFASHSVELRTIFCITRSIDDLYEAGLLSEGLYMALGVSEVQVPPLRKCPEDVPVMAQQFIVNLVKEKALPAVPRLLPKAQEWLAQHDWQGNTAELREVMHRALARSKGSTIGLETLVDAIRGTDLLALREDLQDTLQLARREFVAAFAALMDKDPRQTAEALGTNATTIQPFIR